MSPPPGDSCCNTTVPYVHITLILGEKFIRLAEPYGNCTRFGSQQFPTYPQKEAKRECLDRFYRNKCNCTLGRNYIPDNSDIFCANRSVENAVSKDTRLNMKLPNFVTSTKCLAQKLNTVA